MKFVEGRHRSEIVNIKTENFITERREERVIKLEERQLHTFLQTIHLTEISLYVAVTLSVDLLKMTKHRIGALHYGAWHAGKFGHMNTETVFRPSAGKLAQEHHLAVYFLYRDIEIDHPAEFALHLIEFMVVGCKEGLWMQIAMLVDMLYDGPCY